MAVPTSLKQIGWFVALWVAGVGAILVVGSLLRLVLMPG